jgi:hypothetical protein
MTEITSPDPSRLSIHSPSRWEIKLPYYIHQGSSPHLLERSGMNNETWLSAKICTKSSCPFLIAWIESWRLATAIPGSSAKNRPGQTINIAHQKLFRQTTITKVNRPVSLILVWGATKRSGHYRYGQSYTCGSRSMKLTQIGEQRIR